MKDRPASTFDLSALTVGGVSPSVVSIVHAARLLDVSDWTVRRWINEGKLPARKLPSGSLRIAISDLEEFGEPVHPGGRSQARRRA